MKLFLLTGTASSEGKKNLKCLKTPIYCCLVDRKDVLKKQTTKFAKFDGPRADGVAQKDFFHELQVGMGNRRFKVVAASST